MSSEKEVRGSRSILTVEQLLNQRLQAGPRVEIYRDVAAVFIDLGPRSISYSHGLRMLVYNQDTSVK